MHDRDEIVRLHGRDIHIRTFAGSGIPILLVHGIGASMETWGDIPNELQFHDIPVIAIDLPGHGESSKAPGDYSLGSMASTLRDVLDYLGHDRVHIVGHSLGGGISMQFVYQFPERLQSMVLVSSGGLGEEVFPALRAAALPGANLVLRLGINARTLGALDWAGDKLSRVGIRPHALTSGAIDTVRRLADVEFRTAFISTVQSVIDTKGQRVSALDKLHAMNGERVLIIWGDADPMIPIAHGERAHELLQGSRFEVFPGAGHEPHAFDVQRFVDLLRDHAQRYADLSVGTRAFWA
jgi:pimeloyl-ACP methyl ester carboxylesterase